MKYTILIAVTVDADPADFGTAARKGFDAIADKFNEGQDVTAHILPQDGSREAVVFERVLRACFTATTKAAIVN